MDIRRSGYSRAGSAASGAGPEPTPISASTSRMLTSGKKRSPCGCVRRRRPAARRTSQTGAEAGPTDQPGLLSTRLRPPGSEIDLDDTDKFARPVITDEVRGDGGVVDRSRSSAWPAAFPTPTTRPALLNVVLSGRRAFRRIPPCRVDLADYYSSDPATADATYSTRAALIEGWRFDRAAFGISQTAYYSADPAHWLALETAASVLAAAGFAGGSGLSKDRAGVFIGNTLTGDGSRSGLLRLRWPYARQALADALFEAQAPPELADRVLEGRGRPLLVAAAAGHRADAGGRHARLDRGDDLRAVRAYSGGGFAVDTGGASSLSAIASACSALVSGELDVAMAGGVDVSLDPLDLVGLAKTGVLATADMRIYDENPTGFLPGEGCGLVLLMRTRRRPQGGPAGSMRRSLAGAAPACGHRGASRARPIRPACCWRCAEPTRWRRSTRATSSSSRAAASAPVRPTKPNSKRSPCWRPGRAGPRSARSRPASATPGRPPGRRA